MTQGEFHDQEGDADYDHGDNVGNEKGTAAVAISFVGKAPDVAQADGGADGSKEFEATQEGVSALVQELVEDYIL